MSLPSDGHLSARAKIAGTFGIGFGFFAGVGVTGLSLLVGMLGVWALVYGVGATGRPLVDRKSTRLNSSHVSQSRMPSSA